MTNLHLFLIKYMPATNSLPSRIKITSERFRQSVTISYDYSDRCIEDTATKYLETLGYNITNMAEMSQFTAILSDTFMPLKKGI